MDEIKGTWGWAVAKTDENRSVRRSPWPLTSRIKRGGFPLYEIKDGIVTGKKTYPGHCKVMVMDGGIFNGHTVQNDSWVPRAGDKEAEDWELYNVR